MLEIKPSCENCGKQLLYNSTEALICSFECTFCKECVDNILHNVCPNCGGGFEKRPIRPMRQIDKHPPRSIPFIKPLDKNSHLKLLEIYKHIEPHKR